MDGFLMVVRCCVDDVPVGLFETLDELQVAANGMTRKTLAEIAKAAGFPPDAVPIEGAAVQAIEFRFGRPVGSREVGIVALDDPSAADADVSRIRPAVDRFLAGIQSQAPVETLLLAVADSVQDSSARVGEDASDTADDVRRLVSNWRRRDERN